MCEKAAEAHKSKGTVNFSKRNSGINQNSRDSSPVDALLTKSSSILSQVCSSSFVASCLHPMLSPFLVHALKFMTHIDFFRYPNWMNSDLM